MGISLSTFSNNQFPRLFEIQILHIFKEAKLRDKAALFEEIIIQGLKDSVSVHILYRFYAANNKCNLI